MEKRTRKGLDRKLKPHIIFSRRALIDMRGDFLTGRKLGNDYAAEARPLDRPHEVENERAQLRQFLPSRKRDGFLVVDDAFLCLFQRVEPDQDIAHVRVRRARMLGPDRKLVPKLWLAIQCVHQRRDIQASRKLLKILHNVPIETTP
ncbi:MAG: hypothetical protein EKK41_12480 [Hyphomicrobiales bacterium]|nr:MAG: hypothetical protein EKK41_12480 [Hyphomicrobiales bacterium]